MTEAAARTTSPVALVRALRPHQWVKNLLVFVPILLDHRLTQPEVIARGVIAFAAFCLAASGAYVVNDLLDLEADRSHPTKRYRPFASGALAPRVGYLLAPALIGISLLIGAALAEPGFLALLLLYIGLTTAYSAYLKRFVVLDVLLLAGLYTLRVLAGITASGVRFSTWLLAFSTFLFLSLAFLKRHGELSTLAAQPAPAARRRGYFPQDMEWLRTMGAASAYLAVLVLALYLNSDEVVRLYRKPAVLFLVCPLLLYWTSRMWLLAHRGQIHEDPIVASARDPSSYVVGALVLLVLYSAL
ncbi:MAG TPA: UbiA family prenyltransferase [Gemmatimonadales bacterium]|nr:UbiA family prenyltransferase [Gemmatimonadales bacterium]